MKNVELTREMISISAGENETILDIMRRAGLRPDAPCGGNGRCGKCRVRIKKTGSAVWESVLACRTSAEEGMQIDTMSEEKNTQILTEGMHHAFCFAPMLEQICASLPPCPNGKSISDWTRFEKSVCSQRKNGDSVSLLPNPQAASSLKKIAAQTGGFVHALVCGNEVLAVSAQKQTCYMAAFDIGTTTVAGFLLDADDGKEVAVSSRMNPQAQFGADVINRANYTLEKGAAEVTSCIRRCMNEMIEEMTDKAGASVTQVYLVSVVGNTCMHHLFLGISVDSLVHAPYNPAIEEAMMLYCRDYEICCAANAKLLMVPNIAGFVGADTVGCLVASDLAQQKEWTLLIDIGTNGEMVLGKDHQMAACSTAAGPAFEGAGIRYGMRGAEGAISKVCWQQDHWEIEVIGGGKAKGICGSGLLDAAAALLDSGQMDEMGQMDDADGIILADEEHSINHEPVLLVQKDIRELQLAKAAIASGIYLLSEKMGIEVDDIQQVWLAGAFGSFLSPKSACRIGMIPPQLIDKIRAIGNAAGEGAKLVLRDQAMWEKAQQLARQADFLELAGMPAFQDRFVDELEFPEMN